ncbi:MAG: succinate dehydrogenase cytochrome b subunit [Nitriliruptoraceae bacterium]|nr:succinate dehydrogenase cytochrome b subunit [Nitriliruptoraceae bacterium]
MATKVSDGPGAATRRAPFVVELYRSALGKKYVMAITGIVFMGYVLAHMLGNLKLYQGAEEFNEYAEFLRQLLYPILPESATLNILRLVLLLSLVGHVVAAAQLTAMNRKARPERYQGKRDYVVADFAARTMRWTGVIVLLFLVYHLADLTWGWVNPAPEGASVYDKVIASFSVPAISAFYLAANLALGVHLYHGVWSLFQSMGWNNRRFNHWRRTLAIGFTVVVVGGNLSFPIAVLTGIID